MLKEHINLMDTTQQSVITPWDILHNIQALSQEFTRKESGEFHQQDAHELYIAIADAMQTCTNRSSVFWQDIGGELTSSVKCMSCQHISHNTSTMLDYSIDIQGCKSLSQALTKNTFPEILDGDNKYFCERCGELTEAVKELTVSRLPNLLTVHLKRFNGIAGDKITKKLKYPERLECNVINSSLKNDKVYYLQSVVVHRGQTCVTGHYHSFCKINEMWYSMNDEMVYQVPTSDAIDQDAYLLLYVLTDKDVEAQSLKQESSQEQQPVTVEDDTTSCSNNKDGLPQESPLCTIGYNAVYEKDMHALTHSECINDNIINAYFALQLNVQEPTSRKCEFLNTNFYTKLEKGYGKVKRWTRKMDIFYLEKLFIPIHLPGHWCLAVIDFVIKQVTYFDSLSSKNKSAPWREEGLTTLKSYLIHEMQHKHHKDFDDTDWTFVIAEGIPKQRNILDCGPFVCQYAAYIIQGQRIFNFSQGDMANLRQEMARELKSNNPMYMSKQSPKNSANSSVGADKAVYNYGKKQMQKSDLTVPSSASLRKTTSLPQYSMGDHRKVNFSTEDDCQQLPTFQPVSHSSKIQGGKTKQVLGIFQSTPDSPPLDVEAYISLLDTSDDQLFTVVKKDSLSDASGLMKSMSAEWMNFLLPVTQDHSGEVHLHEGPTNGIAMHPKVSWVLLRCDRKLTCVWYFDALGRAMPQDLFKVMCPVWNQLATPLRGSDPHKKVSIPKPKMLHIWRPDFQTVHTVEASTLATLIICTVAATPGSQLLEEYISGKEGICTTLLKELSTSCKQILDKVNQSIHEQQLVLLQSVSPDLFQSTPDSPPLAVEAYISLLDTSDDQLFTVVKKDSLSDASGLMKSMSAEWMNFLLPVTQDHSGEVHLHEGPTSGIAMHPKVSWVLLRCDRKLTRVWYFDALGRAMPQDLFKVMCPVWNQLATPLRGSDPHKKVSIPKPKMLHIWRPDFQTVHTVEASTLATLIICTVAATPGSQLLEEYISGKDGICTTLLKELSTSCKQILDKVNQSIHEQQLVLLQSVSPDLFQSTPDSPPLAVEAYISLLDTLDDQLFTVVKKDGSLSDGSGLMKSMSAEWMNFLLPVTQDQSGEVYLHEGPTSGIAMHPKVSWVLLRCDRKLTRVWYFDSHGRAMPQDLFKVMCPVWNQLATPLRGSDPHKKVSIPKPKMLHIWRPDFQTVHTVEASTLATLIICTVAATPGSQLLEEYISGKEGVCTTLLKELSTSCKQILDKVNQSIHEHQLVLLQGVSPGTLHTKDKRHRKLKRCQNLKGLHSFTCSERKETINVVVKKIKVAQARRKKGQDHLERKLIIIDLLQEKGGLCSVADALDRCGTGGYESALMWVKHMKRNIITGVHAIPMCVLDPPKKAPPSLRRKLMIMTLLQSHNNHEHDHELAIEYQCKLCRQYGISTEETTLKPQVKKMKESIQLIQCEKTKRIVKNLLMESGFSQSFLHKHLNFRYSSLRDAAIKVNTAKGVFKEVWKDASSLTKNVRKARTASRQAAVSAVGRSQSELAHRPRKNVDPSVIEGLVQMASMDSDSGMMAHEKRHYDVMYASSVNNPNKKNKKLSLKAVTDQYNEVHSAMDENHEDVSTRTIARRCLAPHQGHKTRKDYTGEAAVKFGKVPCKGTGPPPLNMQYARAFAKLTQFVPFRFSSDFVWFRRYSSVISSDLKYPIFLGTKNSFSKEKVWVNCSSNQFDELDVVQSLPSADYHDQRAVVVPSTNLLLTKTIKTDRHGKTCVSWEGSKLAVVLFPKCEYSTSAINHVNERWQLRWYGDDETRAHLTLPNTDVQHISLQYLLEELLQWLELVEQSELREFLTQITDEGANTISLTECLRSQARQLIHLPTSPLYLVPSNPSDLVTKILNILQEHNLTHIQVAHSKQSGPFTIVNLIETIANHDALKILSIDITEYCSMSIMCVLEKLLESVILSEHDIEAFIADTDTYSNLSQILELLIVGEDQAKIYLRKCNACVLMLEVAEFLESAGSGVELHSQKPQESDVTLYGKEVLSLFLQLLRDREGDKSVSLFPEPRPLHARYTDGGPDQKQQNLQTKVAGAIEFRLESSSHACIMRRAETCSYDNEAERGNAVLSKKCASGSSITAKKFLSIKECLDYLEEAGLEKEEIGRMGRVAEEAGSDFLHEMNMWWGVRELGRRWNGQPCFGAKIYATPIFSHDKLPLSPSLDDDLRAFCKASKENKKLPRFKWIRLNMDWYERHGRVFPSGYYEECLPCEDPQCCITRLGKRAVKHVTARSPKLSVARPGHYADFFTPTSNVADFFSVEDLEGDQEDKFQRFIRIFPTEKDSIIYHLRKGKRKVASKVASKDPVEWFPDKTTTTEELFSKSVAVLSHCLEEICRCEDSNCFYRIRGVKYDLVCRLFEHIHKDRVTIPSKIRCQFQI